MLGSEPRRYYVPDVQSKAVWSERGRSMREAI